MPRSSKYASERERKDAQNAYRRVSRQNPEYRARRNQLERERNAKRRAENPEIRARENARSREWSIANPDKVKLTLRKFRVKTLGWTLDEFNDTVAQQGSKCEICLTKTQLVPDHDHKTGKRRGAICNHCNIMLGNALDSTETLGSAIKYLEGYSILEIP